ncbi:MAG: hypothetical protein WB919_12585 [Candidatus Sulfotelmatobacter sp.]
MRALLPLALALVALGLHQPNKKPDQSKQAASTEQRGTQESPVVVEVLPAEKTQVETDRDTKDRNEKTKNDRNLVRLTGILAGVGFLQLLVFGYQAYKLRETVEAAADQSNAMERHIKEAARSATAMEQLGKDIKRSADSAADSVMALRERTAQQMRAYITVITGTSGFYQDRANSIKFQGNPVLINTGQTPASKISYRIKAGIMRVPPPDDFAFPLPQKAIGGGVLGPQQTGTISGIVEDFIPDIDVNDVRHQLKQRALYVWGIVSYADIFGATHTTKFCQSILWFPDNTITGFYTPGHNEAD